MSGTSSILLDAAFAYTARGFRVVPVPAGRKGPIRKGWQELRLGPDELALHFNGTGNIGLLLGEPSGHLIDVDLDCDEALELADEFLPNTSVVTGRPSAPRSHRWYVAEGVR
ncbi:MAG: bifunctional DNA primase/polymerase [Phycisphaerales bacterium]